MKLEPNTLSVVVKSEDKTLTEFTRNTPLCYYHREKPVCIVYVQTVDRISPNKYKFYGTSAIGPLIEGLWDGISGAVTRDDMYTEAAADYEGKVTQVIVTEHQYVPWTEEKQLFEDTAQAEDIITFDEPMHTLTADGFTILVSGANWAKVSAGSGVLAGKTYLHNTRQVSKDVWNAQEPNVKTVEEATLVSLVNSQACVQRMADYYKCRERVAALSVQALAEAAAPSGYATSKYSVEEIDALLDKVAAMP